MNIPGNYRSQLFTLRLWLEPGVPHPGKIRFKVQHLLSGEVRYFGDGPALIAYLVSVIQDGEDDAPHHHRPNSSV